MNELQKFISEQMVKLGDLSVRKFADKMGVHDTTLGRVLHPTDPAAPTVEFLIKLAKATNTDIRQIIVMVSPDDVVHGSSATAASLLTRIDKLSDEDRKIVDKFIAGAMSHLAKTNDDV